MTAPDAVSKAPYQKIRGFCFMQIKKLPCYQQESNKEEVLPIPHIKETSHKVLLRTQLYQIGTFKANYN